MASLWGRGIPTVDEYSQWVSPQSLYFLHMLLQEDVRNALNWFVPWPAILLPGAPASGIYEALWRALQLFGVRYVVGPSHVLAADEAGYSSIALPRRELAGGLGLWQIYELPHPNLGDYSPTVVVTASSGPAIMAAMIDPNFDFTKQAVLSAPIATPLVAARDMQVSPIRDGLHVSGHSDATSLVILPQQYSNCLSAHDGRVRLVRTDLIMTGILFSGDLDTDISFDYGMFAAACRMVDLQDVKRLQLKIDLPSAHLASGLVIPSWQDVLARLRGAARDIK